MRAVHLSSILPTPHVVHVVILCRNSDDDCAGLLSSAADPELKNRGKGEVGSGGLLKF